MGEKNRLRAVTVALTCGLGLLACGPDAQQAIGSVGAQPVGFAVVSSDRTATSVSLLGPGGELLSPGFVHSGSATTGLVTALSGDVVVPTRSGDPNALTLIDRLRTDVITRIDPGSGAVFGQVKTHTPNDGKSDEASFSSNPQDYVYWGEHDAWVTRFQPNVGAEPGHPDRGLDLLHIDPTDFQRGDRISLWPLNSQAERQNPDTLETERVTSYARPSAMVRLGDKLMVGIASLSLSFDAAGPGLVAWVDPEARSAEGFELPGLQNCGDVAPVPGDATRAVVACSGFFRGEPRSSAGLAILKLEEGELSIEHLWRGADHPESALAVSSVVSLGGTEVVAVELGQSPVTDEAGNQTQAGSNDGLYLLDIASGEQRAVLTAEGRFVLGPGAFSAETGLLLVPDASSDEDGRPTAGIRTLERRSDGSLSPRETLELDPILPARLVRPF